MSKNGIRVALPGTDVSTAPDYNLVFSSDWPNLKIGANPTVGLSTATSTDQVIYTHNLGFIPAFIPFIGFPNTAELTVPLDVNNLGQFVTADANNIYFIGDTPPVNMGLLIFVIDITQPFTAPVINTGSSGPAVNSSNVQYGIRVAKAGRDISDLDVRHFILRSDCRSPMVHAVATGMIQQTVGFSYTHDLSYNPIFFAYQQVSASNTQWALVTSQNFGLQTQGNTITLDAGTAVTTNLPASIVILQDPFIISDNEITVSV